MSKSDAEKVQLIYRSTQASAGLMLARHGIDQAIEGVDHALQAEPDLHPELRTTATALVEAAEAAARAYTFLSERLNVHFDINDEG